MTSQPNHSDKAFKEELAKVFTAFVQGDLKGLDVVSDAKYRLEKAHQQAVKAAEVEARIEELESFEPFFKGDHKNCPDPTSCIGYQNAQNDYDNERDIRIAELKGEQE